MITTISIVLLALAIIGNTISIWYVSRSKENTSFISSRPLSEHTSYETANRITTLEETLKDAQPLIDRYKKERKKIIGNNTTIGNVCTKVNMADVRNVMVRI